MLCWKILFCLVALHRGTIILKIPMNTQRISFIERYIFPALSLFSVIHLVRSQDEDEDENEEESTTIPLSTTTDGVGSAERTSSIIPSREVNNMIGNTSEQNVNPIISNESSKQRIIIALAVLCAALAVLLGFLISIVVCQWWQHDTNEGDLENETNKSRPDLVGSSYNYHNQAYRQTVKL